VDVVLLCFFLPIGRKLDQFQPEQFLRTGVDILCIALFSSCSWLLLFFEARRLCEKKGFPCLAIQAGQIAKNHCFIAILVS